jgi:membrane-bound lytic murein transglycosylase D
MKSRKIKLLVALGLFMLIGNWTFSYNTSTETKEELSESFDHFSEDEIKERIEKMDCLIEPQYNSNVKGYLRGYLINNRDKAERILGRAILYFPLFEKYLKEEGMPEELKYLSVVESALVPEAVSRVGATGLWQFMEATGKSYGLTINRTIDERSDPVKSTKAAMAFLSRLHDRFGEWELALAAYNAGGGRVSRAIKRGRSKNFWRIRRYLPRETRNYVPAFISATYLMNYYDKHQLSPQYPDLDYQLTDQMIVKDYLSFYRIAQITGLPLDVIEYLNPSYNRGYIPDTKEGQRLVLPKRVMPAIKDYLAYKQIDRKQSLALAQPVFREWPQGKEGATHYFPSIYIVNSAEQLDQVAQLLGCSRYNLMAWNQLKETDILHAGQQLIHYLPKEVKHFWPNAAAPISNLPQVEFSLEPGQPPIQADFYQVLLFRKGKYIYYRVQENDESWEDIASKFERVSTRAELLELNNSKQDTPPKPGSKVKIKELGSR